MSNKEFYIKTMIKKRLQGRKESAFFRGDAKSQFFGVLQYYCIPKIIHATKRQKHSMFYNNLMPNTHIEHRDNNGNKQQRLKRFQV